MKRNSRARDRFFTTLTLVSRIPIKRHFFYDPKRLDFYLPLVGLLVALLLWFSLVPLVFLFSSPLVAALLSLSLQYFAFNLFHLDGLLDTADAFLGSANADKRLLILKDSRIGVYAFFTGCIYLIAKLGLLFFVAGLFQRSLDVKGSSAIRFAAMVLAALAFPLSGRIAAALVPSLLPPAREDGLGFLAKDTSKAQVLKGSLMALSIYLGLALLAIMAFSLASLHMSVQAALPLLHSLVPATLCISLLASLGSTLAIKHIYGKGLGGYTGDALGAAVELGELSHLALAAGFSYFLFLF